MTNKLDSKDLSNVTGGENDYTSTLNLLLEVQEAVEHFSYIEDVAYDYHYRQIKDKLVTAIEAAKLSNTVVLKESIGDIVALLDTLCREFSVLIRTFRPLEKRLDEEYLHRF